MATPFSPFFVRQAKRRESKILNDLIDWEAPEIPELQKERIIYEAHIKELQEENDIEALINEEIFKVAHDALSEEFSSAVKKLESEISKERSTVNLLLNQIKMFENNAKENYSRVDELETELSALKDIKTNLEQENQNLNIQRDNFQEENVRYLSKIKNYEEDKENWCQVKQTFEQEKALWLEEKLKLEEENQNWCQVKQTFEQEKALWLEEKLKLEQEKQKESQVKQTFEQEKALWSEERIKLEEEKQNWLSEKEALQLEIEDLNFRNNETACESNNNFEMYTQKKSEAEQYKKQLNATLKQLTYYKKLTKNKENDDD